MKETIVGIDLGTTNSAVAYVRDGTPQVIPIDGQPTMPSCVGIDPSGKLVVGQAARNMLITSPESTILSVKRRMGERVKLPLGDKSLSPEEVSSLILRRLKDEAEKALGQPIRKAVVTVPAFFDETQRKATQIAGELAGLEVVRIINEPTAAALAYDAGQVGNERILVYDLGGGTFDVSVVVVEGGVVEVKASHGDTHLGGDDFDQLLVQRIVDEFQEKHGVFLSDDPRTMRRLKVALERAKCRLSDEPFVKIHEEYIHGDLHLETEIQRDEYEEMIAPYIRKTLDCIHQSMQDAQLLPRDLSKVMLVGGATRTPLVHRLIEESLQITPRWEINPDLIVALGASIPAAAIAGEKSKSILVDITPHSYGIEVLSEMSFFEPELRYAPIIHRNTPLPVSKSEGFATVADGQREVEVTVYQGEDPDLKGNRLVGKFRVEGLSDRPAGNLIIVSFNLDLNGMLKVTATEKDTGFAKTVTLDTRGAKPYLDMEEARNNILAFTDAEIDVETEVIEASSGASHPEVLKAAADLRKRSEALLSRGVAEDDAKEIQDLLKQSGEAVRASDWDTLESLNESLSDIVYYLED